MDNLRTECENLVRKYKRLRLIEREYLRRNKMDNNEKIIKFNEIITDVETILGYTVSVDSKQQHNSIKDRLDAIEKGND